MKLCVAQVDLDIPESDRMHFALLGSGSKGNSLYVASGRTAILIDAGFSGKEIVRRMALLDKDVASLNGIFLTHEHGDHTHGAGVLSRRCRLPVYANAGTFKGSEGRIGKLHKRVEFETGTITEILDLQVRSFAVFHDTLDPVGYLISDGCHSIACCTDTGKVSHLISRRLQGCDALVLEFNHDPEMLKTGPYPLSLQQRVRSSQGHLSNEDAAEFLDTLLHDKLQHIVLAHLSETNNRPQFALQSAAAVINSQLLYTVKVASQSSPTEMYVLR